MSKYELGGEVYPSKKAVRDRLSWMLTRRGQGVGGVVGRKGHALLCALLGRRDLGPVRVMSPRSAGQGGSHKLGFYEVLPQGVHQTVGYGESSRTIVSPYVRLATSESLAALGKSRRQYQQERAYRKRISVARSVIQPQIDAYRDQYPLPPGFHVDHLRPFQDLLNEWCELEMFDLSRMEWNEYLRGSWARWHDANAVLQGVPAKTNLSKGGVKRKPPAHPRHKPPQYTTQDIEC